MFDLEMLTALSENNRIEAKKARGGLPESIWESYSAFANTLGGVILLGVVENKDLSLNPIGLTNPQQLIDEFWRLLPAMTSSNILLKSDVKIEVIDKKEIVVITVPRATRTLKPIYVGGNVYLGSYKRDGEGDYRCSKEEVDAMLLDANEVGFDMKLLPFKMDCLKISSVDKFMSLTGVKCDNSPQSRTDFLKEIGAVRACESVRAGNKVQVGEKAVSHFGNEGQACDKVWAGDNAASQCENGGEQKKGYFLTMAALLTLGSPQAIARFAPKLKLTYKIGTKTRQFDNLLELLEFVRTRLKNTPLTGHLPAQNSLLESVVNAVLNNDYSLGGIECVERKKTFKVTNFGLFCVDVNLAISGGISSVRCSYLSEMLKTVVGVRRGVGISAIFNLWNELGFRQPSIKETFEPPKIVFTLSFFRHKSKSVPSAAVCEQLIIDALTGVAGANSIELERLTGLKRNRVAEVITSLQERGVVVCRGGNYKLKR